MLGQQKVMRKAQVVKKLAPDNELFEKLRQLRLELATKQNLPPYVIFSDKTLYELAEIQPQTTLEMLQIKGVGENKLQKYGAAFLELLQK